MNLDRALLSLVVLAALDCHAAQSTPSPSALKRDAALEAASPLPVDASAALEPDVALAETAVEASSPRTEIGPYEIPFLDNRTVYFVLPRSTQGPQRLIANLHGMCNPPGYACGYWVESASEQGALLCPTGNARCGPEANNAPTWTSTFAKIDADLEVAIETVNQRYPGLFLREGAILTGFSKGAYAAVQIAQQHPGRWPYLILNEAAVGLSAVKLRAAGVRAVALIAGERGSQLPSERATTQALVAAGFPARLWVMPGAGHFYSTNIDQIMREAMEFVLSAGSADSG